MCWLKSNYLAIIVMNFQQYDKQKQCDHDFRVYCRIDFGFCFLMKESEQLHDWCYDGLITMLIHQFSACITAIIHTLNVNQN